MLTKAQNTASKKLNRFIENQPVYRLLIVGVLLFLITWASPRYVAVIPGISGMAVWFLLLSRAIRGSIGDRNIERPWWL
jgi:hypothetical protein